MRNGSSGESKQTVEQIDSERLIIRPVALVNARRISGSVRARVRLRVRLRRALSGRVREVGHRSPAAAAWPHSARTGSGSVALQLPPSRGAVTFPGRRRSTTRSHGHRYWTRSRASSVRIWERNGSGDPRPASVRHRDGSPFNCRDLQQRRRPVALGSLSVQFASEGSAADWNNQPH